MRRFAPWLIGLFSLLFFLVLLPTPRQILYAQISGQGVNFQNTDPSGSCANPTPLVYDFSNGKLWGCDNGTWTQIGGGSSGVTQITVSSPLTGGTITTTGTIACATCATTTNGGALTATSPVTISAAGVIACGSCSTSSGAAVGLVASGFPGDSTVAGTTTVYNQIFTNHNASSGSESQTEQALGTACTASNLTVSLIISGQPSGGSLVITLRQNAASPTSGPVVTIPSSSAAGAYQDTTHTVALAATDMIDFQIVNNSSSTSGGLGSITFVCK
jgi:hypothetical protein